MLYISTCHLQILEQSRSDNGRHPPAKNTLDVSPWPQNSFAGYSLGAWIEFKSSVSSDVHACYFSAKTLVRNSWWPAVFFKKICVRIFNQTRWRPSEMANFSLDEVLNQDILNNDCVERPVDYLQKVIEALGSFTREKICQNVAFFVDECVRSSWFSELNVPREMTNSINPAPILQREARLWLAGIRRRIGARGASETHIYLLSLSCFQ